MASAVLASRNESSWAQSGGAGGGFMGKTPYSHTQLNPNHNPNPKKKQKQFHHTSNGRHIDESPAVTQTASDDAYSFNQRPIESTTNVDCLNFGGYLTFNVVSYNKGEVNELRSRLLAEVEQIRNLKDRIESGQLSTTNPRSQGKSKKLSGNKRPTPSGSSKDPKKLPNGVENRNFGNPGGGGGGGVKAIGTESMMKECRQILAKLMKHKNGWIFNIPVDAEALGLHDYHQIIKRPMDLGTVKSNLAKNFYPSPFEFAADVRLTFNNALLYNPKTDQVNGFAEQLLGRFEDMFRPLQDKMIKLEGGRRDYHPVDELQGSSWNHIPTPERVKKPKATPVPHISKKQERMQNHSSASTPSLPVPPPNPPARQQSPLSTPSPVRAPPSKPLSAAKVPTMGKQPKPRAKDPNKREMNMEEKHKLGVGLQSLPQEKMPQLVQIIRKRNEHLAQDGDEIELDIEALDTETLWELDRFVTNWKKMVSKTKRQALMINNLGPPSASAAASAATTSVAEADGPTTSEKNDSFKKPKKGDVGEEDVEIEDDEPATHFPPVEIEKDEGGGRDQENGGGGSSSASSSSSSSSGSSSSSDSDSGSSSGSDSDADDAHS